MYLKYIVIHAFSCYNIFLTTGELTESELTTLWIVLIARARSARWLFTEAGAVTAFLNISFYKEVCILQLRSQYCTL